jgi:hypothetical protein
MHDLVNPDSACLGRFYPHFEFFLYCVDLHLIGADALGGRGLADVGFALCSIGVLQ